MSVTVISSVYGGYDEVPSPPEQTVDTEWIMVGDNPDIIGEGWKFVYEPRGHMHARLAAKVAKCLPWQYTNARTIVWMDGSCRLLKPDAIERVTASGADLAQILHPWRNDILEEADASAGLPKYEGQTVHTQAQHYLDLGHPRGWGMWATGLIVRRLESRRWLDEMGHRWLTEQMRWTYQDQISEPWVLRLHGLRPETIPFPLHGSGVLEWLNHRDSW